MLRRMFRRLVLLLLAVGLLTASPALAQSADDVAAQIADTGVYVDRSLPADPDDVGDVVAEARNRGVRLNVVLLEDDPLGGATTFADALLDRLGEGTIVVLSANQEGAASTEFSQSELERALDAGFEADAGDVGYVEAFVAALVGEPVSVTTTVPASTPGSGGGSDSGGGGGGFWVFLLVVGGLVALVWFLIRRSKRNEATSQARLVDEARTEIKKQLDALANTILAINDQVALSDTREDNAYFEAAGVTYNEALESFEDATDLKALEALSDRLDEARWQLDAALALAEGRPVPDKPKPEDRPVCFFDPTHPTATEEAVLDTPAGKRTVRVCRQDADKLRRGEQPAPRMIEVGGRRIPAPMAPKSYGGGGLDLGSLFSILVGGMSAGRSVDWGKMRPPSTRSSSSRRTWGSGSGIGRLGRPSGSSGSSSSRSSSSSSRSSSSSSRSSSSRSRAGRTRSRGRRR